MLTDRERQTWREIQRHLAKDDDFRWSSHSVERRAPGDHLPKTRHSTVLAALTLIMLLFGPNPLTEAEVADRRQAPLPQESTAPARGDLGENASGTEWMPAQETPGQAGPADTRLFRPFDISV